MIDEFVGAAFVQLSSFQSVKLSGMLQDNQCLSILVYGELIDAENVGRLLAEHKLWLQHPNHELTLFEPYFNPQWLSPPG